MIDQQKARAAATMVNDLVKRGVPRGQAVALVHRAIARIWASRPPVARTGMGDEVDQMLMTMKSAGESAPVKAVREAITPWLWVTSLVGFGMGLMNTRRISLMFTNWKNKKKARTA